MCSGDRALLATMALFLAAGTVFLLVNLHLPLVRNALIYEKVALNIIAHGFNPLRVIGHPELSYGKPGLFGFLAVPLVWLLGVDEGVKATSFLGTVFFMWMVGLTLPRLNRRVGMPPNVAPLEFTLVALNPLVLYQFWSGHPDSLLAGLVLLAFLLTDIIATEPERDTRPHIVALGAVIYVAILAKFYGAILGLACPLYLLLHARTLLARSTHRQSKIVLLSAIFATLGVALILAKLKLNPTLDFAAEEALGGGFNPYMQGITNLSGRLLYGSLQLVVFTFLLNFHASLLVLLTRGARAAWPLAPTVFVAVYVLGLFPFDATSYNMRYLLPAFPFLAVALAAGARSIPWGVRLPILGAYAALAVLLVLHFNLAPVHRTLEPLGSRLARVNWRLMVWLDNLRLAEHLTLAHAIDRVNREVARGDVLYWSSNYYGTATHMLAGHLGIRKDIDVRYVLSPKDVPPSDRTVYLTQYSPDDELDDAPTWANVKLVGDSLFRLEPRHSEPLR